MKELTEKNQQQHKCQENKNKKIYLLILFFKYYFVRAA